MTCFQKVPQNRNVVSPFKIQPKARCLFVHLSAEKSRFSGHSATYVAALGTFCFASSVGIGHPSVFFCPVPNLPSSGTLRSELEHIHVYSASASVTPLTKRSSAPSLILALVPCASTVSLFSDRPSNLLISG